jgi:hypothetical protein
MARVALVNTEKIGSVVINRDRITGQGQCRAGRVTGEGAIPAWGRHHQGAKGRNP